MGLKKNGTICIGISTGNANSLCLTLPSLAVVGVFVCKDFNSLTVGLVLSLQMTVCRVLQVCSTLYRWWWLV